MKINRKFSCWDHKQTTCGFSYLSFQFETRTPFPPVSLEKIKDLITSTLNEKPLTCVLAIYKFRTSQNHECF